MEENRAANIVRRAVTDVDAPLRRIKQTDSLVMLGSCFAQYMGEKLTENGYAVSVNPLGTLFNPFSIGQTIRAALDADGVALPLFETDGEWRCWWANTRFKAPTAGELDRLLRERYRVLGEQLRNADHLVLTLGTNVCYVLKDKDIVVTNCQRQPDRLFREWRASLTETVAKLSDLVGQLLAVNPGLQIILTVSPYRYHKYGYHGSQLSKAVLLLAEDELISRYPQSCCYFPAYEILLDELRDYAFYAPDGQHPGPDAVQAIWQRFKGKILL